MSWPKKLFSILFLSLLLLTCSPALAKNDTYIQAEILEVLAENDVVLEDGSQSLQQKLRLRFVEGERQGQEVLYEASNSFDTIQKKVYRAGDKVMVLLSVDDKGEENYFITDYARGRALAFLAACFLVVVLAVSGRAGLRSILSLVLTFGVIIFYIVPQIIAGASPLIVTSIGSLGIVLSVVYVSEGWRARSHIAVTSLFVSLLLTLFLSWFFISLLRLSGASSEEAGSLLLIAGNWFDFRGLLLAGIIIGCMGVLDDVVVAQIAATEEIAATGAFSSTWDLFRKSYRVGLAHISSMINTLFLTYAGVSLPLFIIFASGQSAFADWAQLANNEEVASEIARALIGSIGLMFSVPLSTWLSSWWFSRFRPIAK